MTKNFYFFLTVAILMCGPVVFGLSMTFPALTSDQISKDFDLSRTESTMFNALTSLFAIAGPFAFNHIIETRGRKLGYKLISFFGAISFLILCFSTKENKNMIFIHRATSGIVVGGFSSLIPLYLVEIADVHQKELFGSFNQLGICIGCCAANLLGGTLHWRVFAWLCFGLTCFMSAASFFIPESPVFLNNSGGSKKKANGKLFSAENMKAISQGALLMFFQQFSGINAIKTNIAKILDGNAYAAAFGASAQFFSCLICSAAISKYGLKKTWIISCTGASVSLVLLAVSQIFELGVVVSGIAVFGFEFAFGFGLGPIPWLFAPSMFSDSVRNSANSFLSSLNWLLAFIVIAIFPTMISSLGLNVSSLIFAVIMFAAAVFGVKINNSNDTQDIPLETEKDL